MAIRVQRHANSVNKQRYWVDLTLARPNGAYVVVALIGFFMKV